MFQKILFVYQIIFLFSIFSFIQGPQVTITLSNNFADPDFKNFTTTFKKTYSVKDLPHFLKNFKNFRKYQIDFYSKNKNATYKIDINKFSDLSWEEFEQQRLQNPVTPDESVLTFHHNFKLFVENKKRFKSVLLDEIPKPDYSQFAIQTPDGIRFPNEKISVGKPLFKNERRLQSNRNNFSNQSFKVSPSANEKSQNPTNSFWNSDFNNDYEEIFDSTTSDQSNPRNLQSDDSQYTPLSNQQQNFSDSDFSDSDFYDSNFQSETKPSILPTNTDKTDDEEARLQTKFNFLTTMDKVLFNSLEKFIDWRPFASSVKDQSKCAACYAFSAIGTYEVLYKMFSRKTTEFSVQEIVDCDTESQGCVGGLPAKVYDYINYNGIHTTQQYPYSKGKNVCSKNPKLKPILKPFKYYFLDASLMGILKALQYGPVNVLHSVNKNFKNYKTGVFNDNDCAGKLNHSAVAVGYDLTADVPYINFKNAWGPDWGENGYYRLAIGELNSQNQGVCNIASHYMNSAVYF